MIMIDVFFRFLRRWDFEFLLHGFLCLFVCFDHCSTGVCWRKFYLCLHWAEKVALTYGHMSRCIRSLWEVGIESEVPVWSLVNSPTLSLKP